MEKKKKITPKKVIKAVVNSKSTSRNRSSKKKLKKRKEPDSFKRYRKILSIVSSYNKEHGLKPGRDIYKQSSEIYRNTKDSDIKFISQNIDRIYEDYIQPSNIKTTFPDTFPFYVFSDNLNIPKFDGVIISVHMDDGIEEFSFEGYRSEMDAYYKANIHGYLRKHYNKSPTAIFRISNTDQQTFVNYVIETGRGKVPSFPQEPVLPKEEIKKSEPKKLPTENIEKQIEFEKAKKEADIESQNKMRIQIELINSLTSAGLTSAEIKKYLGI